MTSLPVDVYSVAAVRAIDRAAIEDAGIPGYTLMSRAGKAAVAAAKDRFPDAKRWHVICGAGNNAGDGYVVARLAACQGIAVSVAALVDPENLSGDAATAYQEFAETGSHCSAWTGELDASADLIVDAMLGSGLIRDVEGSFADAVFAANEHAAPVLALDIPTGLQADSGAVLGCAVQADLTVTFVGLKTGLFLADATRHCGEIVFAGLDIPLACRAGSPIEYRRISDARMTSSLPKRPRAAHKGDFGHVLVIGGGPGMPGAVRLCGEAALRAGAGRVSIATHPEHAATIAATRPELMSQGVAAHDELDTLLGKADVIALGPGLGRTAWAGDIVAALANDDRPAVWDADALNWLARSPATARHRIITPHPGEAATLLGSSAAAVQGDRKAALAELRQRFGGLVVLKGAGTLVGSESGVPWLCTAGNPGMAAAGMGDVLTGIIAAFLAQGLAAEEAATLGVAVHARAGDLAAMDGERGLLASDLLTQLRGIINP